MFFMVTSTYPNDKSTEMGRAFLGLPELPSFVKRLHELRSTDLVAGAKVYTLYEVENEKLHEGMLAIAKEIFAFINIVGFKSRIEPVFTAEEALAIAGLAPP